jgi:hypothetical protein
MHRDYFGDAKDLAKRFVIDLLRGKNTDGGGNEEATDLLGTLFVFPMISSEECRDQAFLDSYRHLLGNECELLVGDQLWGGSHANRDTSLGAVNHRISSSDQKHTVFLDPDTGVTEEDDSLAGRKRIKKRDVICLLRGNWDRVVVIYDESFTRHQGDDSLEVLRFEAIKESISKKMAAIAELAGDQDIGRFAYVGMALNLIFCSTQRATGRLNGIRQRLASLLGSASTSRIVP